MIEWLTALFLEIQKNPIAAGIFGSVFMTSIFIFLRKLPTTLINFFYNYFTTTITVMERDDYELYMHIERYFIGKKLKCFLNHFSFLRMKYNNLIECKNENDHSGFALTDNYSYYLNVNRMRLILKRTSDESEKMYKRYVLTFRFFSKDHKKIRTFLDNLISEQKDLLSESNKFIVKFNLSDEWEDIRFKEKVYGMKTPFHLTETSEQVYKTIATFLNSKEKYIKYGKPYYDGLIFSGDPGCGKSYLIQQLCNDFNLACNVLNMSVLKSDSDLINLITSIDQPTVVLFEDIDCLGLGKAILDRKESYGEESNSKISLSTILNILDGIYGTCAGIIFIATTNHIDKLDPALIRSGRFNTNIKFKPLNKKEICNMLSVMYPEKATLSLNDDVRMTTSDLTKLCFKIKDINSCVAAINQLTSPQ